MVSCPHFGISLFGPHFKALKTHHNKLTWNSIYVYFQKGPCTRSGAETLDPDIMFTNNSILLDYLTVKEDSTFCMSEAPWGICEKEQKAGTSRIKTAYEVVTAWEGRWILCIHVGRQTSWRRMAKRWQTRRDLGGTLITTQVQSSKLYIPNCKKKPPADEEFTFHSDYFLKKLELSTFHT